MTLLLSKHTLFIHNAGNYKGEYYAYRHHDADRACVESGNKDEKNKHQRDGRDRDLPVLRYESYTESAEESGQNLSESRLENRRVENRSKGSDKQYA